MYLELKVYQWTSHDPPFLRVGSLSPVPSLCHKSWGCLYLASFAAGGPGSEVVLCLALAAPPAGSGHRPGAGAGRPHARLCHHDGPVVPGWPPSALRPELYLAGLDVQPDGVLSVDINRGSQGHCSMLPPLRTCSSGHRNHQVLALSLRVIYRGYDPGLPRQHYQALPPVISHQVLGIPVLEAGWGKWFSALPVCPLRPWRKDRWGQGLPSHPLGRPLLCSETKWQWGVGRRKDRGIRKSLPATLLFKVPCRCYLLLTPPWLLPRDTGSHSS